MPRNCDCDFYLAPVQTAYQIQIGRVGNTTMDDKHPIVDDCAQRKPSVDLFNQLQQTFGIVLAKKFNEISLLNSLACFMCPLVVTLMDTNMIKLNRIVIYNAYWAA